MTRSIHVHSSKFENAHNLTINLLNQGEVLEAIGDHSISGILQGKAISFEWSIKGRIDAFGDIEPVAYFFASINGDDFVLESELIPMQKEQLKSLFALGQKIQERADQITRSKKEKPGEWVKLLVKDFQK